MKVSQLRQIIKEELENTNLDNINKLRKGLYGARNLRRDEMAFLKDKEAHALLNQLINYFESKIKELGGNI